jgi:hypothetical protein
MRQFLKINISSPVSMICELSEVSLAADSERRVSSCSMPVRVDTCRQHKEDCKTTTFYPRICRDSNSCEDAVFIIDAASTDKSRCKSAYQRETD